jgi:hypothetical protein
VFNSNVQPKRRMREKPGLWHCNCRKPLGRYQLNAAHLKRCSVCGVARHSDPTVATDLKLAPEACTRFAGLRWGWQNLAAAMIEAPRRHGHFDPRWHTNGVSSRDREHERPSMIRTADDADARVSHDVGRFPRPRHALRRAVAGDDGPSIQLWENEGGSYSMTDERDPGVDGWEKPPAGLEWYAFSSRYFPDRRRHDLEVLKAYETYGLAAAAPSISHRSRTPPRVGPTQRDGTRGRARPHARSSANPRARAGNSVTVVGRAPIATVT